MHNSENTGNGLRSLITKARFPKLITLSASFCRGEEEWGTLKGRMDDTTSILESRKPAERTIILQVKSLETVGPAWGVFLSSESAGSEYRFVIFFVSGPKFPFFIAGYSQILFSFSLGDIHLLPFHC